MREDFELAKQFVTALQERLAKDQLESDVEEAKTTLAAIDLHISRIETAIRELNHEMEKMQLMRNHLSTLTFFAEQAIKDES